MSPLPLPLVPEKLVTHTQALLSAPVKGLSQENGRYWGFGGTRPQTSSSKFLRTLLLSQESLTLQRGKLSVLLADSWSPLPNCHSF